MKNKYYLNGKQIIVLKEFVHEKRTYCMYDDGNGYLEVTSKHTLTEWEETYQYAREKEHKDRLEKLEKEKEKIIKEIQDQALTALISRLKINAIFSKDNKLIFVGVQIANELKKLLIEKTKKIE